jgi:hypothetical protein
MFSLYNDVVKWLNEFCSTPVSNTGFVGMMAQIWSNYRSFVYDFHFGNDKNALSTPRLYESFISRDTVKKGSKILEVSMHVFLSVSCALCLVACTDL